MSQTQSSQSMSMQSSSQCKPAPKKKQKKFSHNEDRVLVSTVMAHANELFGKNALGALKRSSIWEGIARKVNKFSETERTVISCKKRLNEYKRKITKTINNTEPNIGNAKPQKKHWSKQEMSVIRYFRLDSGSGNKTQQASTSASGTKVTAPPAPRPRPQTMDSFLKATRLPPSQTKASAVSLPGPSTAQTPPLAQQQSRSPSKSTTPSCRKSIEEKFLKLQNDVEELKQIISSHFDLLEQMSNK
ncbi:myb-related transcription factor, partner of profilin-like [Xenopus laevis]|uniref:Myb-like domain-containing protein n=2 Tax=Xenopus laevis TaxID=8355 RepID=A0A974HGU4_XENLA|nr:myb-related transcription factor, partner of profilin-like [Xenopus laevis]OCT77026.1 hypothetical protein XELAEV_18032229mg [Xenopus laevis]